MKTAGTLKKKQLVQPISIMIKTTKKRNWISCATNVVKLETFAQ